MVKTTAMLLDEFNHYQDSYGKIRRLCQEKNFFVL